MSNKYIKLDGILIEVEENKDGGSSVSSGSTKTISDKHFDQLDDILLSIGKHLKKSWDELNQEVKIKEATVELSLGIEAEGNLFIAKGKTSSQVKISMKLEPENKS